MKDDKTDESAGIKNIFSFFYAVAQVESSYISLEVWSQVLSKIDFISVNFLYLYD